MTEPDLGNPGFLVEIINGEVVVTPQGGLPNIAAPTLLRIAARNVERSFGLD